jgi:hypoxanthine phosphoribosyltransferase
MSLNQNRESPAYIYSHLGKTLFSRQRINAKVRGLAGRISRDYARNGEVTLISNLKGSFRFLSDLCASISLPVRVDFMSVSAYRGEMRPSVPLRISRDLSLDIHGCDVVVVEDIVDTGATLQRLNRYLRQIKGARSVRVCALLDKTAARKKKVEVHYRGFVVPDQFIVGYGLDYREYFRELNRIAEYNPEPKGESS